MTPEISSPERDCIIYLVASEDTNPEQSDQDLRKSLRIHGIEFTPSSVTESVYAQVKITGKRALQEGRRPEFMTDLPPITPDSLDTLSDSITNVARHALATAILSNGTPLDTRGSRDEVITGLKAGFLLSSFCGPCKFAAICPTNAELRDRQANGDAKLRELAELPTTLLGKQISDSFWAIYRNNAELGKGHHSTEDTKRAEQNSSTRSKIVDALIRVRGPMRNVAMTQAMNNIGAYLRNPQVLEGWEGFIKGLAIEVYVYRALREAYGEHAIQKTSVHQDVHEHTDWLLLLADNRLRIDAKSRRKFKDHTYEHNSTSLNEIGVHISRPNPIACRDKLDILVITPVIGEKKRGQRYYDEFLTVTIGDEDYRFYDLDVPVTEHFLALLQDAVAKFSSSK